MRLFSTQNRVYFCIALQLALFSNYALGYGLKLGYALLTFLLLISIKSRVLHHILVLLLAITGALYYPIADMYGHPNLNSMLALQYTNAEEAKEFIGSMPWQYWFNAVVIVLLGLLAIAHRKRLTVRPSRVIPFTLFILAVGVPFGIKSIQAGVVDISKIHYPPVRFVVDAYDSYAEITRDQAFYDEVKSYPTDFEPTIDGEPVNTVLVVIGESVRRDRMSAYGFTYPTTPYMDKAAGTLYTDYIAAGPSTVLSLTHSLFRLNTDGNTFKFGEYVMNGEIEYNNSVVNLVKAAGYSTYWISNQRFFGEHDAPFSAAAQQADRYHFTKRGNEGDKTILDTALNMPVLTAIEMNGPKVIFVHLNGSHPQACERTAGLYEEFYRSVELSCYLQSIKNTDSQLHLFTNALKSTQKSWALLYTADHGLMAFDDGLRERYAHGDRYKSDYDVPLFIATSSDTAHNVDNTPLTGFQFLPLVARLANIKERSLAPLCDVTATCSADRQIIRSNGRYSSYSDLTDEPE